MSPDLVRDDSGDVSPGIGTPGHESLPVWPVDTNLVYGDGSNKLKLMLQRPLVRLVIQDAIENVKVPILFTDAFPDAKLIISFAKEALLSAAKRHCPATYDIYNRLTNDDDHIPKINPLVCILYTLYR